MIGGLKDDMGRSIPNASGLAHERIVAAACQIGDMTFSIPGPARHHHVLHKLYELFGGKVAQKGECREGFLTSSGRYVDRVAAVDIAIKAGQIAEPKWPPWLFSEDLW